MTPESGALTYSWSQSGGSPTVALSDASAASPTFSAPQLTANAALTFTLTVTDPLGVSASDTVAVTVRADDDVPSADAGVARTTYEGDSFTLDGSGSSDPEGGTLTWAWSQSGGTPTVTLSGENTATPSFTAPQVTADASLTFTLTVTDGGGQSASASVAITLRNVRPATSTVRAPASGETLEPAMAANTASSWETAEYTRSIQLPFINASAGHAARTMGNPGGGGITIATYDGALNSEHPDLTGITQVNLDSIRSTSIHGTRVIGVAAARRNDNGMHGVAYNANIVDITRQGDHYAYEAAFASAAGLDRRTFSYPGWRYSYTSDPAGSAHIIIPSPLDNTVEGRRLYLAGMRVMAGRGRIIVAATGNATSTEPYGYPAKGFAEEGIAGHAIGVTALNEEGTGWDSRHNQCGSIKCYCPMAPTFVYTTDHPTTLQPETDSFTDAAGTSYAAPAVAGAAAVVWAAFPNKNATQIVERLLTTARQIDDADCNYDATTGISAACGHGLLDLGAAMNPVGFTSVALPGASMVPVRESFVQLPPGASVEADPVLADAIVYDEQGFPFLHDLNGAFLTGATDDEGIMDAFLALDSRPWQVVPLGGGAALSFAGPPAGARLAERAGTARELARHEPIADYRLSLRPRPGLTLTLGHGAGAPAWLNGFAALPGGWDLFRDGLSVKPFAAFAGQGLGLGLDWQLGRTTLAFATRDGRSRFGASRASLTQLGLTRHFGAGLTANVSLGMLRERGARLGMRSFGGFGAVPETRTDVVDVSVEQTVLGGTVLFGSYSRGVARERGAAGGLVRSWGEFRADALAVGVETASVLTPSDRVTATVTAPFRPRGRVAEVLVPVREESDGVVVYAKRAVNLASATGREVRTQLVYEAWSADDTALTIGGWTRYAPGDTALGEQWGLAAKIRFGF